MEEWRDIAGWEGIYQVSNQGRVCRTANGTGTYAGRMLKPFDKGTGYWCVQLLDRGRLARCRVHRLVAIAFVAGAAPELDVHHKNGDKLDNRPENLEWCTRAEHVRYRTSCFPGGRFQGIGELNGCAKLTAEKVRRIRGLVGKHTQKRLGQMFGVAETTIGKVLRRKSWAHVA